MGAVPGISDSRGMHAGRLLPLSRSDVSHSVLTAGILGDPRPSGFKAGAVSCWG